MDNTPLYITPVGGREQQFVGNLIILNNITKFKELDSAKPTSYRPFRTR